MIDNKLMKDVLRITGLKTKREVMDLGLRTLLELARQEQARQLKGRIAWDGDLDVLRTGK